VAGTCRANSGARVALTVQTTGGGSTLQESGTSAGDTTVVPFDVDTGTTNFSAIAGQNTVDVNVIARDTSVGDFARIDLHGTAGSPCTFWGMVIPPG
jgi:hypothetical protein